jgi:hypothetical protein
VSNTPQWYSSGGGTVAVNLNNAQTLSVTGSGPYSIQALVAGTQYTLDGLTYTTAALAQGAIASLCGEITTTGSMPGADSTVVTGNVHDV